MLEALIPLALGLLAAFAWFMAMFAGSFVMTGDNDTLRAKIWYVFSIMAVEFVAMFAWIVGRAFPLT